jgi:small GTP-binding protein
LALVDRRESLGTMRWAQQSLDGSEDKMLKLVVVGDGAVGKTCLLVVYAKGSFPTEYVPTVFENYKCKVVVNGAEQTVQLWDTAGQEELENVRILSYPNTHVFLFCFSVADRTSYENIKNKWFQEVKTYQGSCNPLYLLVGTKSDLRNDAERPIEPEEGRQLATQLGCFDYMECSAIKCQGVNDIFQVAIEHTLTLSSHGGCCNVQ